MIRGLRASLTERIPGEPGPVDVVAICRPVGPGTHMARCIGPGLHARARASVPRHVVATASRRCKRSSEANLAQSLHLLNSSEVQGKLSAGSGRAVMLANEKDRADEAKLQELYLWVYSRPATPDELAVALAHIEKHKDKKQTAYEDILWALVNTKEFLFNH